MKQFLFVKKNLYGTIVILQSILRPPLIFQLPWFLYYIRQFISFILKKYIYIDIKETPL